MTECPRCGNKYASDYCEQCGEFIDKMDDSQQHSLAEKYVAIFYTTECPECGTRSELESTVCSQCGTELTSDHIQSRAGFPNNPGAAFSAGIGFILGAGAGVIFYEGGAPYLVALLLLDHFPALQDALGGVVFSRDAWILFGGLVGATNAWDFIKSA